MFRVLELLRNARIREHEGNWLAMGARSIWCTNRQNALGCQRRKEVRALLQYFWQDLNQLDGVREVPDTVGTQVRDLGLAQGQASLPLAVKERRGQDCLATVCNEGELQSLQDAIVLVGYGVSHTRLRSSLALKHGKLLDLGHVS